MTTGTTDTSPHRPSDGRERDLDRPEPDPLDAPGPRALLTSVDAVRSMSDDFWTLFAVSSNDGPGPDRSERRLALGSLSAVEHVLCVREALQASTHRLERLARDARPVRHPTHDCKPVAGYHRWELQEVLRSLAAEAEHLARAAEQVTSDDGLAVGVRQGVEMIATELLRQVARYGAEELEEARAALRP